MWVSHFKVEHAMHPKREKVQFGPRALPQI